MEFSFLRRLDLGKLTLISDITSELVEITVAFQKVISILPSVEVGAILQSKP